MAFNETQLTWSTRGMIALRLLLTAGALALVACDDDPSPGTDPTDGAVDDDGAMADGDVIDDGGTDSATPVDTCEPLSTDYAPNTTDAWAACISDDGEYNKVEMSVGTVARIAAFESMATEIFTPGADPSVDDFAAAYAHYATNDPPNSLQSRVATRYDAHFGLPLAADAVDGIDCTDGDDLAANPDFCVGPAYLNGFIEDQFEAAATTPSRVLGARIEAALVWFLYASQYKESLTCTTTPKDCDSAWAYVTGGAEKGSELGLGRYIREIDDDTADRVWTGALAVRCWRDLDKAEDAFVVTYADVDSELRDQSRNQYDRATLDGVALIVVDRLAKAKAATGDTFGYHWEFVKVLGQALDRQMTADSSADAETLRDTLALEAPSDAELTAAATAIANVFPLSCE